MSNLFTYPRENWYEQYLYQFTPRELDQYKFEKTVFQLAGVFQHNQVEFDLGDLKVFRRFELELENMDSTRFKTSDELRESSFLEHIPDFNYETDETLSKRVVVCVMKALLITDLCYRFGDTAFSNHVKDLLSSRQDEAARILSAARKCKDCWIPWSWIKDMSLLCENEFSSVYTAYIKPPFVGTHTTGQKVYIRKVTDTNIVLKIYHEIEENCCIRDNIAITFDPASGHVHFVAFSGEHQYQWGRETASLEQELATPFNGWASVLTALSYILMRIDSPSTKREYHGQLHPKNIFRSLPVQFIWHRAVRDCLTDCVYGRLPYLAPEVVESNAVPNLKWDIYAFGVIMWQMVSRVVFPPNQYLDKEVYQIDRVPGVPEWYEQLYMACMDRNPSKRPTLEKIKADIELRSPKSKSVRVFHDIRLEPVDRNLLAYQNTRAEKVKAHLEGMSAPDDILWQSTSRAYTRQEIVNEIGFNLRSF